MHHVLDRIQIWDEQTIIRVIAWRGLPLTRFMKTVSLMGDGYLWGVLAVFFFVFTDVSVQWLYSGLTAFAVELICYKIIKQTTSRHRPFKVNASIQNLVVPQDEYSFPSGHTAAATVAALLFSMAVPALIPLFAGIPIIIGISRIYLGVHYPSDVLMGFTLGVFSFTLSVFIF